MMVSMTFFLIIWTLIMTEYHARNGAFDHFQEFNAE
jgi:hypothetical protein